MLKKNAAALELKKRVKKEGEKSEAPKKKV